MPQYVLCVDRGTTAIKATLFDFQANEIACGAEPCPPIEKPHAGWCEQDLDLVWDKAVIAIQKLLNQGYDSKHILSIGVSGMGNGLNLLDKEGRPTRKCITSLDSRAEDITRAWRENERISQLLKRTGSTHIVACTPMAILRWVKDNEPEIYKKSKHVIYSKDWIRYCLTDIISTDYTDTSGSLLVDLDTNEYMHDLFRELGLEKLSTMLPSPKRSYEVAGYVTKAAAARTGLTAGTPVITGAHDIAACSYGCGGTDSGHLALIFGTVGLSLGVLEQNRVPYGLSIQSVLPDRWLFSSCIQGAGAVLDWLIQNLFTHENYLAEQAGSSVFTTIDQELAKRTPTNILCHPFLYGKNDPAYARSNILGIGAWHDKYDILLAYYQGIVYAFYEENKCLLDSNDIREVWLVGGGSKSKIFGQIFADTIGKPVHIPTFSEATGRGVALCCLICLGLMQPGDKEIPHTIQEHSTYTPRQAKHQWYMNQFQKFTEEEIRLVAMWKWQNADESSK